MTSTTGMVNELIFFTCIFVIVCALIFSLRMGKETTISFVAVSWLLANIFVLKQIRLFGLEVTAADALAVGATLGLNMVQEYYGKSAARTTIWAGFFCLIFYAVLAQIHGAYIPSCCDRTSALFGVLLSQAPRLVGASLFSYLLSQYAEYLLYGFMQNKLHKRHLLLRNYMSVSCTQLLDTVVFSLLGLYGIVHHIGHVIIMSYLVKIITLLLVTPVLTLIKAIIKQPTTPSGI